MTKKDFILIAKVIQEYSESKKDANYWGSRFANELAKTDERFDKERFINACCGE